MPTGERDAYKFTRERRDKYLDLLRKGNRRHKSARAVGMSPRQVARWVRDDPEFAQEVLDAETEAAEDVEDALYQAATDKEKPNMTAIQVYLYNRAPDRWQDKRAPSKIEVGGKVEIEAGPALERIAALHERLNRRSEIVDAEIVEDRPALDNPEKKG